MILAGGDPREWSVQPGKRPSRGTIQYVRGYLEPKDAAAVLARVFPDAPKRALRG